MMRTTFPSRAALFAALSLGFLGLFCAAAPPAQAQTKAETLKQAVTQADGITNRVVDKVWEQTDEYWHHGDYNRIVALIRFIVEADPTFYEAYGNGAWLLWSMGDTKNADEFLEYGIARAPQKWVLQYEMGFHLYNTKRYAAALPYLEKALKYPKGAGWPPWHTLAHCYDRLGQTKKSLQTWEYIVRTYPNDAVAKPNLARLRAKVAGGA